MGIRFLTFRLKVQGFVAVAMMAAMLPPLAHAQDDEVVARVNGQEITAADLAIAEEMYGPQLGQMPEDARRSVLVNALIELRIVADVPPGNNSISYDFAFFSTEYPEYHNSAFNDMYIGWLESESWTGNISFDENGQPISLNAGFLDFQDDGGHLPEFVGTCMRRHAGTKWLSTTAPVTPGEQITLVFAIFDLSDSILDSYVFLDNFQWGCDGTETPKTTPVG